MEIRIYSDNDIYLAKAEDGSYAVGSLYTVKQNLERLHSGDVTQLPCSRPLGAPSSWRFLLSTEPVAIIKLEEVPVWLS